MALSEKDKKQLMGLAIALPLIAIVAYWYFIRTPKAQEAAELRSTVDSLSRAVDSARRELASGTVEQIRQRVADFESGLSLMRELVPTDNEVAQLINDISDRAKLRNVHVSDLSPMGYEDAGQYRVARYRFSVLGHYDDVGAFLSDIASLRRIMVPAGLTLVPTTNQSAQALGDTTGALLQASFQLRAFVKQQAVGGDEGGAGGAR
jgi:type IV pilus assembly protein PilO